MHGLILTHAYQLQTFESAVHRSHMNAAKYVTGWGLQNGWNYDTRWKAMSLTDNIILRTIAGDPSYNNGQFRYPTIREIEIELFPWLEATNRMSFWLELGNEPNTHVQSVHEMWVYRWFLLEAIQKLRKSMPFVRLIAPALIIGDSRNINEYKHHRMFLEICQDVYQQCDAIAVHVYEHDAFNPREQRYGTTRQVQEAAKIYHELFPNKDLIITEYGLNHNVAGWDKGARYQRFSMQHGFQNRVLGFFAYHYCEDRAVHPQYHFTEDMQNGYRDSMYMRGTT